MRPPNKIVDYIRNMNLDYFKFRVVSNLWIRGPVPTRVFTHFLTISVYPCVVYSKLFSATAYPRSGLCVIWRIKIESRIRCSEIVAFNDDIIVVDMGWWN